MPDQEDFDRVEVPAAEIPEDLGNGLQTIADAKRALFELAVKHKALTGASDKKGVAAFLLAGTEAGLDIDNALAEYEDWVRLIEEKYPLNGNGKEPEAEPQERLI